MEIAINHNDNISNPDLPMITDQNNDNTIANPIEQNKDLPLLESIKNSIYDEINYRIIVKRDKHALEILQAAKDRVRENIQNIKWAIIAMKPFYLMAAIAIMNQKPEIV